MERKNLALLCAGVVCFWLFALAFGTAQGNGLRQQNPAVQAAADQTQPVQPAAAQPALELPCRAACLIEGQGGARTAEQMFTMIDALSESVDERGEEILGDLYDYGSNLVPES